MMDYENDGFRNRTSSDKWILTFARDNLALSVPIIGALIFAFRCVLVSAGDPHVAFIIATQTSVGDAIRALLFTVIPALLLLLSIVIALTVGTRIHYVNHHNFFKILGMGLVSVALSLGYGFLTGSFQEEPLIGALVILSFPFMAFGATASSEEARKAGRAWKPSWLPGAQSRERQDDRVSKLQIEGPSRLILNRLAWGGAYLFITWLVLYGLLLLGSTLVDETFWLPRERLIFQNEAPFTGYVLRATEDRLVVLNDAPRIIVEKPKSALQDRDFCYPEDHKAVSSKVRADSPVCPGS